MGILSGQNESQGQPDVSWPTLHYSVLVLKAGPK